LYLILGPLRLPGDGDLYWQRWLGETILQTHRLPSALGPETFTAMGTAWVPQEWLFSLALAAARDRNVFIVFAAIVSLLPLGVLLSIVARARGEAPKQTIGIALLFAGMALAGSFGIRAQVLGWFCFAWLLFFLERRGAWRYAAIPIAVGWANLHASVMLAPLVVVGYMLGHAIDRRWRDVMAEVPLLAGVAAATCCTPLGLRLPEYALTLARSPIRHFIVEWQPSSFSDPALLCGALPLAIAIVIGLPYTFTRYRSQAVVAALLFGAAIFATRNIPLFAIAATPLAAIGIAARFPKAAILLLARRDLQYVALPAVAVALVWCAFEVQRQQITAPPRLPVVAISSLARDGSRHRVFCEDFTWCSIALQYPDLRVFIDGRCDPYPLLVWQHYIDVVEGTPQSRTILASYGVDAVVAKRDGALARDLNVPPWRVAARDQAYVLFRRD
jgi:hypothetical protein